jgi:hypothetical protein
MTQIRNDSVAIDKASPTVLFTLLPIHSFNPSLLALQLLSTHFHHIFTHLINSHTPVSGE